MRLAVWIAGMAALSNNERNMPAACVPAILHCSLQDSQCMKAFMSHAGGTQIVTRVVRRSEENPGADRINTSEFFEQVFQVPDKIEPKVRMLFPFSPFSLPSMPPRYFPPSCRQCWTSLELCLAFNMSEEYIIILQPIVSHKALQ